MSEENFRRISDQFGSHLATLSAKSESAHRSLETSMQQASRSLREELDSVERAVACLNVTLEKIGAEKIQIEVRHPPRRRWSFFRKNNGTSSDV
jgi:hypothetical protein